MSVSHSTNTLPSTPKCPCYDCLLTEPISGNFTTNTGPELLQLENHKLPAHLQAFDIGSPNLEVAQTIREGTSTLVELIYRFAKYSTACIFYDLGTSDEDHSGHIPTGPSPGTIGSPQYFALAAIGQGGIDWGSVWATIWWPQKHTSVAASEAVSQAAYNARLLASDAAVGLELKGFPRLDQCSPHRVRVFGQRVNHRQGYCLQIHSRRHGPPKWSNLNTGPSSNTILPYDTNEISSISEQDELVRLRVPKDGLQLLGDQSELAMLGPIRLAHELILKEWAVEATALSSSRLNYRPHLELHVEAEQTRTLGHCTLIDEKTVLPSTSEKKQFLDVNVEVEELAWYFRVVRRIQEIFVLNELVLQCTRPVQSIITTPHAVRVNGQMDTNITNDTLQPTTPNQGLPTPGREFDGRFRSQSLENSAIHKAMSVGSRSQLYQSIVRNSWHGQRSGKVTGTASVAPVHCGPAFAMHDPTLSSEPQWHIVRATAIVSDPIPGCTSTSHGPQECHSTTPDMPVDRSDSGIRRMPPPPRPPPFSPTPSITSSCPSNTLTPQFCSQSYPCAVSPAPVLRKRSNSNQDRETHKHRDSLDTPQNLKGASSPITHKRAIVNTHTGSITINHPTSHCQIQSQLSEPSLIPHDTTTTTRSRVATTTLPLPPLTSWSPSLQKLQKAQVQAQVLEKGGLQEPSTELLKVVDSSCSSC